MGKFSWGTVAAFLFGGAVVYAAMEGQATVAAGLKVAQTIGGAESAVVRVLTSQAMLLPMAIVLLIVLIVAGLVLFIRNRRLRAVIRDRVDRYAKLHEVYRQERWRRQDLEDIAQDRDDLYHAISASPEAVHKLEEIRTTRKLVEGVISDRRPIRGPLGD